MTVTEIKSLTDFQQIIGSGKPVVVDFWAEWCGPCKAISPVFHQFSEVEEYNGVEFYKVDVDEQTEISQEVGIKAMPTFILFKDGKKVADLIGANPQGVQQLLLNGKSLV